MLYQANEMAQKIVTARAKEYKLMGKDYFTALEEISEELYLCGEGQTSPISLTATLNFGLSEFQANEMLKKGLTFINPYGGFVSGAAVGSSVGLFLGPPGAILGGAIGGVAGSFIGKKISDDISQEKLQRRERVMQKRIKLIREGIKEIVNNVYHES